jgi:DNA-binding transcriptional LysR family regulator
MWSLRSLAQALPEAGACDPTVLCYRSCMRFDLTDLRLFLNVYEAGTITGGAEASHMTLASASERIRAMEDTLGVPLLVRERRGVQLTAAGRALARNALRVLHEVEHLQGEMADYGSGLKGHIRLLCNTSALSEHLPAVLGRFLADQPGITVDLDEQRSDDIVDALRTGLCDIGVVSDVAEVTGLQAYPLRPDPLVLVVPHDHALAGREQLCLVEVADLPFIGLPAGSALQEHIDHYARRLGKRLHYRMRLAGFESICRLVGQGIGVAIVPRPVAMRWARGARIGRIALGDTWAKRGLLLCVRRVEDLPSHVQKLVAHVLGEVQP